MEKLETDKKLLQLQIQQSHSYNTVNIDLSFDSIFISINSVLLRIFCVGDH